MPDSVRPQRRQPTRLPHPWDSPGKNTGVGCYFLLQCRKVKSESEVVQSCPTLSDPMDYSPPGSSIHGTFQAWKVLEYWSGVPSPSPIGGLGIPFNPAIWHLSIYPKKTKTLIRKDICTPMFIAALFTVAKVWKLSKFPPTDKGIKKKWYGSVDKESTCNEGDLLQCRVPGFDPWVRKIPWRWKWQPTLVILPGKSHGQKSLHSAGSDMTEQPSTHACNIHTDSEILFGNKKVTFSHCDNTDETRGYYAKWNKLRERHCMILLVCRMWKTTNEQT